MPVDKSVNLPEMQWYLLNEGNVDTLRIQVQGNAVELAATVGSGTEPTGTFSTIDFDIGEGHEAFSIAANFPGITGANCLWARPVITGGKVSVSHA
ncbi:MAG: hypothetical protein ACPG61_07120 [Paracoccaceae bacterium]